MILVGLGSNLTTAQLQTSEDVLEAAINALINSGVDVIQKSPWYRSAPIPASEQPWFVNGVASLGTQLGPRALLQLLHEVETEYGRVRGAPNASRTLDLDLLAYGDRILDEAGGIKLPHPRLAERAFVLQPLADLAPCWRHPVTGLTAAEMLAALPPDQVVERLSQGGAPSR
ncbi:MAG: 2-amino-4-hydroxy-6-hydroxymethyldihydropteridine diphosphokinase [Kiloniellaceae bacterium]